MGCWASRPTTNELMPGKRNVLDYENTGTLGIALIRDRITLTASEAIDRLAVGKAALLRILLLALAVAALSPCQAGEAEKLEFFETNIRPLLIENCYACHTQSKMGGLRLDSRETMVRGGSSGPAIRPGNAAGSILIQAVSHTHDRLKMPPSGTQLSDKQIEALAAWIQDGAAWPKEDLAPQVSESTTFAVTPQQRAFWSFRPVSTPAPPEIRDGSRDIAPVDRFILARLEEQGIERAPAADKRTLIRRATYGLIGLPPTPEEIDAFLADSSPDAFETVVERLLASPRYGERWGRYWLDLARYADGKIGTSADAPYPNAFRYRDWVIRAFNDDLPYDQFVRAQLAADLLPEPEREKHLAGLGFLALSPSGDDRVDVVTRTFLGLTVGCAQCHDHKYDPIPTKDFYSLQGVFASSAYEEYPLAPEERVKVYKDAEKAIAGQKDAINTFIERQTEQLIDVMLDQTSEYMMAAWDVMQEGGPGAEAAAKEADLDAEILERWVTYLRSDKEHQFLDDWDALVESGGAREDALALAQAAEDFIRGVHKEKYEIEDRNYVKLGGAKGLLDERTRQYTNLEFLDLKKWYLWRDLASPPSSQNGFPFPGGVYYFGPQKDRSIDRFLGGVWKAHLEGLRAELKSLEEALPEPYPFIHGYKDSEKIKDLQVHIRGDKDNLGDLAPRRFLHILSESEPERFTQGSGRLELANHIVDAGNPLTARVMVNRIWQHHFGQGIVVTPSNYGQLGERPSHPRLLDYLAARFIDSGWSIKAMHREIMLSSTYRLSTGHVPDSFEKDAANKLLWRANLIQRLDAEALRDAILSVSGSLDEDAGGPAVDFAEDNHRRTVYCTVGRTTTDRTMMLFDFPDPNSTSEKRSVTIGPMQRLYFLNSGFVMKQAKALAERLASEAGDDHAARIRRAYELLYGRPPSMDEIRVGLDYIEATRDPWPKYAQTLLGASEFSAVN